MDAGIVATLALHQKAPLAALEVDEMHVPHVSDAVDPSVIVLLNLSRDQLDRVGEINVIERTLRAELGQQRFGLAQLAAADDQVVGRQLRQTLTPVAAVQVIVPRASIEAARRA